MNNRFLIFLVAGIVFMCISVTLIVLVSLGVIQSAHLALGFIILFISAGIISIIEANQSRMERLSGKIYSKLDEIILTMSATMDSVTFFTQPRDVVGKEKYISDLLEIRRYYENASDGKARAKIVSTDFDDEISVILLEGTVDSVIRAHTHRYAEHGMLVYGEAEILTNDDEPKKLMPGDQFVIGPYAKRGVTFTKKSAIVIRLEPPFDYGSSDFHLL